MSTPDPATIQAAPMRFPFGYRHGMSQPSTTLTFSLQNPAADCDLTAVDNYLHNVFEVDELHLPDPDRFHNRDRKVAELAWRILLLGAALLRAVKVPAFDPGNVLAVDTREPLGTASKITLAIPLIEHIASGIVSKAYDIAAKTLLRMLGTVARGEPFNGIADLVYAEFVAPMQMHVHSGQSTVALLRTVHRAGIPFRQLYDGIYQLGWGCNANVLDRSSVWTDSAVGARLCSNKYSSAEILRAGGLPAPQHSLAKSETQAWAAAERLGMPVVVKPVDRDRGEGVTVDICNRKNLAEAFALAASFSNNVLVERQVKGVCHRLYVAQGKLLFAVKRLPKSVTGDGVHTVATLIDMANAHEQAKAPWARLKPFPSDAMAGESLAASGLFFDSIPASGQYAPLRRIQSTAAGGVVEEVTAILHPANIDIAVRAASLLGLASAGIDLISEDVSVPWYSNGAIINEVNYAPLLTTGAVAARYLPNMIAGIVKGDGRIPIEVFVGGDKAFAQAKTRQRALVEQGVHCYLTSHDTTLEPSAKVRVLPVHSILQRSRSLLMDRDVQALLLVLQTDELATTGLPVDRIDRLVFVDEELQGWGREGDTVNVAALRALLYQYSL